MGKKTKSRDGAKPESAKYAPSDAKATPVPAPASIATSNNTHSSPSSSTKRQRDSHSDDGVGESRNRAAGEAAAGGGDDEDLVFEDPFGDEFEPEEIDTMDEGAGDGIGDGGDTEGGSPVRASGTAAGANGMEVEGEGGGGAGGATAVGAAKPRPEVQTKVWRAGVDELTEGEELEYDSTAYHMYHSLRPEWPCLSFDVIRDSLGTNRSRFPHTVFAVAGTQADRAESNRLQVMKLSDLHRTGKGSSRVDGSDDEDEEDEDGVDETDDDPTLDHVSIPHRGGVNRVRSMPQQPHVVATWSETSNVHVWDLERQVSALAKGGPRTSKVDPAFTFEGHPEASGCVSGGIRHKRERTARTEFAQPVGLTNRALLCVPIELFVFVAPLTGASRIAAHAACWRIYTRRICIFCKRWSWDCEPGVGVGCNVS